MSDATKIPSVLLLALLLSGCDDRPFVKVELSRLPERAARLEISINLGGKAAAELPPLDVSAQAGRDHQTFGMFMPLSSSGRLGIGAGVLDAAGCLLSLGFSDSSFAGMDQSVHIELSEAPKGQAACRPGDPVIFSVTPPLASTKGGEHVSVRGWGFRPTPSLSIDNAPAVNVVWRSRMEVIADVPSRPGALGKVQVKLANLDGTEASSDKVFSYYANQVRFDMGTQIPVERSPMQVVIGDVDRDVGGLPDLVVANRGSNTVSLLRNSGQGTFLPAGITSHPVGTRPSSVALADVDGDGSLDAATADSIDNAVSVLLSSAGDPLKNPFQYFTKFLPSAMLLQDLTGDGRPDLIVANQLSADVTVLKNAGAGRFPRSGQRDYPIGEAVNAMVAQDMNRDGRPDILLLSGRNGLRILLQSSLGEFSPVPVVQVGPLPTALAAGDLTNDGLPDLVVASGEGGSLSLLKNQMGTLLPLKTYQVCLGPSAVVLLDVDGDSDLDLAAACLSMNRVALLLNQGQGDGTFSAAEFFPVGIRPVSLVAGDLNRDGRPDLVAANQGNGTDPGSVTVLLNESQ